MGARTVVVRWAMVETERAWKRLSWVFYYCLLVRVVIV